MNFLRRSALFLSAILVLTSCTQTKAAEMVLHLDQVMLTQSITPRLDFDIYIDRLDLNLQEPDNTAGELLTVDLPENLQPDLLYVSDVTDHDPESGTLCDRPRFPHRCTVTLPTTDLYLIKATFADGGYAEKEIQVPIPTLLAHPTIFFPTKEPQQGDAFTIQFADVGADEYAVALHLCKPYGNDGINPCLDGRTYEFKRGADGILNFQNAVDESETVQTTIKDGIVTVTTQTPLLFEESVEYSVTATKRGTEANDIKTVTEVTENLIFERTVQ